MELRTSIWNSSECVFVCLFVSDFVWCLVWLHKNKVGDLTLSDVKKSRIVFFISVKNATGHALGQMLWLHIKNNYLRKNNLWEARR